MIRRLKTQFVLVNMLLITIVLAVTFVAVYASTVTRLRSATLSDLERALSKNDHGWQVGGPPAPVGTFTVVLDAVGKIRSVSGDQSMEIDSALLQTIVDDCLSTPDETGVASGQNLRFRKQITDYGMKIAFADKSYENSTLSSLVETSLLVGLCSLLAFFGISLFLAGWVIKPIERSWEQQKQFVADASHELKTPLTVILANAGIVLSHREDTVAHQSKWVEYIQAEAQRMTALVNDLLYLAKTDDAKTRPLLVPVNISDIAWSGLLPFESVAFEQEKALASDIAPNLTVLGDETRLRQLVVILMDNACKYAGEHGRILMRLDRHQDKVRLTVNNTGEPIPADRLERVFERFYRVDPSRGRENGGVGLGLAIAKSIAETHGGKITVQSSAESGTTFTVTLPEYAG